MAVVKWSPFQELEAMERRMRRLFEDTALPTLPAADVYETGGELVVEIDVPGFDEKELDVELTDHTLTVKGEKAKETEEHEKAFYRKERLQQSFQRSFELPVEAKAEEVKALFTKGVLEIHVPKAPEAKPRKVAIAGKK
jgi:HSP20 family protein